MLQPEQVLNADMSEPSPECVAIAGLSCVPVLITPMHHRCAAPPPPAPESN